MNIFNKKIIKFLEQNANFADNLFLYNGFPDDIKLYTGFDGDNHDFSNIEWLFELHHQNLAFIGANTVTGEIWAIDDGGDFYKDCDCLQNLPYEIIRIECGCTKNGTVEEYFKKNQVSDIEELLKQYENWCESNGIEVDKSRTYHDADGKLFTRYFKKPED